MEQFRTIVKCTGSHEKIGYHTPIVMLGSCFAENIGSKFQQSKFDIVLNPFGITYHPIPVAQNLYRMITGKLYVENELLHHNGLWHSFDHHGRFSHPDITTCLHQINSELQHGHEQLAKAKWLFVTFGTAWGYRLKSNGQVVANCHKHPASEFERIKFGIDEICKLWFDVFLKIRTLNPKINIAFTVSPIRHLREGAHENQLSKSTLLLAIDRLNREADTGYFPAYEIVLDDLRDYRFYNEDMTHPSTQAINYIWHRFCESYIATDAHDIMKEIEDIVKAAGHRPIHHTSATRNFATAYLAKIAKLQERMPHLDFTREVNAFMASANEGNRPHLP